jgi:predicted ATP-grasp superfamily ATP-dependent carboligase
VRVLVTDAEERGSLAAIRGLGQAGYDIVAVASKRPASGHWSRRCSTRYFVPNPWSNAEGFVDELTRIAEREELATVLTSGDGALIAISEQRERLEGLIRLGLPSKDVVRRSTDKVVLLEAAAEAGIASPESAVCLSETEARSVAAELDYPLVIKPSRSITKDGTARGGTTGALVTSEVELQACLSKLEYPVVVQRYEKRPLFSCSGVFVDKRFLAFTAARVLRIWPPLVGSFTYMETVSPPRGLVEQIAHLLGLIGWQGIFQVDLIELGRGRFSAFDLNPRVYASLALDLRAGANLPAIWCDWLLSGAGSARSTEPGIRFRCEDGEVLSFARALRRGWLREAARIARPRRRTVHAYFRVDDPLPLFARGLQLVRKSFRRRG